MRPIYFDILIAAIVVIAALRGKRRGFILTLCGFLAIFVAFIGASIISGLLAEPVAAMLRPVVEKTVLSVLNSRAAVETAEAQALSAVQLPLSAVVGALHEVPFFSGLTDTFQSALESGAVELAGSAALALAEYAAGQLARIVLFILAFAAILIVWWVMSHALDLAFHLPGLNFLNRFGGLVLGFFQGIVLCFILCWLLLDSYITPAMLDGSFLLPYFCGENPFVNFSI